MIPLTETTDCLLFGTICGASLFYKICLASAAVTTRLEWKILPTHKVLYL